MKDALWTLQNGKICRWPSTSFKSISQQGKRLRVRLEDTQRSISQTWTFASRQASTIWKVALERLADQGDTKQTTAMSWSSRPVAFLKRAPNVRAQVLGEVESSERTVAGARRALMLQAAVMGADAVVDVDQETVYGATGRQRRLTGKAVQAVDREGAQQLTWRWSINEIARVARSSIVLVLILIALVLFTIAFRRLLPPAELTALCAGIPLLGSVLIILQDALHSLGTETLLCITWPFCLCLLLQVLRWPQLVRPTALALVACAAAPLLAEIGSSLYVGSWPRDWYSQVIVGVKIIGLTIVFYWITSVAIRLREAARANQRLFGRPPRTMLRWGLAMSLSLISIALGFVLFARTATTSFSQLLARFDTQQRNAAAQLINFGLLNLTLDQFVHVLSLPNSDGRLWALSQLPDYLGVSKSDLHPDRTGQVLDAMETCLDDADPEVRRAACVAIARFGRRGFSARQGLSELLEDPDPVVADTALETLRVVSGGWRQSLPEVTPVLIRRLLRSPQAEQRQLLDVLSRVDRNWAATEQAKEAAHVVIAQLQEDDTEARSAAMQCLTKFGPAALPAVETLTLYLADPDEQIRTLAGQCLNAIDRSWGALPAARRAATRLVDRLEEAAADEHLRILLALKRIRAWPGDRFDNAQPPEPPPPALVQCLAHEDPVVQQEAYDMLHHRWSFWYENDSSRKAIPFLITRLSHDDPQVCLAAAFALSRLGTDFSSAAGAQNAVRCLLHELAVIEDQYKVSPLIGTLDRMDPSWRNAAEMERTVELLIAKLDHSDPKQRKAALAACAAIGPPAAKAIKAIALHLSDQGGFLDHDAKRALVAIDKNWSQTAAAEEAAEQLRQLTNAPAAKQRAQAAISLGAFQPPSERTLEALLRCLNDEDKSVRERAASSLYELGSDAKSAVPRMIDLLFVRHDDAINTLQYAMHLNALGRLSPKWRSSQAMQQAIAKQIPRLQVAEERAAAAAGVRGNQADQPRIASAFGAAVGRRESAESRSGAECNARN